MSTPTYTTTTRLPDGRYESICATLCNGLRLRAIKTGKTAEEARYRATRAIEKMVRQNYPEQEQEEA